jgi:outer membrane lipoprotein-sorting protein
MKVLLTIAAVLFLPVCSHAQSAKPCEELKSEIAQKLDAKGVKSYSLEIVEKDKDAEGKVVGTCEGGTKKIVYSKTAAAQAPAKDTSKPQ